MQNMIFSRRLIKIKAQIILLIIAFLSGCASISHVRQLREAQDEFNRAATLDNQLKLDPTATDTESMAISTYPAASYRVTLNIVSELIETEKQELTQDKLLGTAYTLKALAQWRLGLNDEAVNTVAEVQNSQIELFPRDETIVKGLRGLIKNDQAFAKMKKKEDSTYGEIRGLLIDSLDNLDISGPPDNEELRLYFAMARLVPLKNWKDLRLNEEYKELRRANSVDFRTEQKIWCKCAGKVWESFKIQLKAFSTEKADAIRSRWKSLLSISNQCEGVATEDVSCPF